MLSQARKYLKIGPYGIGACVVILAAIIIRIALVSLGWPTTNSDEGTMGLMALHIAYRGEHPVFLYGSSYLGSLEPHIGAVFFFLFGPSFLALRLSLVLLFALFLLVMYLLTRLLYSEKLGLAVVLLLCFGSSEMLSRELKVVGGAVETMLFGALMLLLASLLALSIRQNLSTGERRLRLTLYACYGGTIGLGLWSHMLVLPFVATSLLLVFIFCRRELHKGTIASFLFGLLLGFFPSLVYSIRHPGLNALATLWGLHSSGGTASTLPFSLWDQIRGMMLVSLPLATGASLQCSIPDSPGIWRFHISSCMLAQGGWAIGFLLLWAIATVLTIRELVKILTHRDGKQHTLVYAAARLMILISGGLTMLSYLFSPASALVPLTSARYLVGLLIMTPALLAPLWEGVRLHANVPFLKRTSAVLKTGLLLFIYVAYFVATIKVFQQVPDAQATNRQQYKMIDDLLSVHITHIYSDYWTCNRVIFQSGERVICSVLDENLQTGQNRYLPYQYIVQQDAQAVYVFHINSPQAVAFEQQVERSGKQYGRMEMDDYILYKPTGGRPQDRPYYTHSRHVGGAV